MAPEPAPDLPSSTGRERLLSAAAWLVALLAVLAVWRTRVDLTHRVPVWNPRNPVGLMKSDPALLFWFTRRIAENDGRVPADFAHTDAVQWPDEVDARIEFPLAQTWLGANTWRWFGGERALHEWCMLFFSLLAAVAGLGVYGLARELTGSRALGLVALGAWCLQLGGWRSTSYVLLGEDVSFPAFALHLWLLARAARVRTPLAFLLSGAFLTLAIMSWHAASFFVAMEAGAFLLWTLRSGENPLRVRHAWLLLLPFVIGCLVEPMLCGKLQLFSLPMQVAAALGGLAWIERRRERAGRPALGLVARSGVALGVLVLAAGAGTLVSRAMGGGLGDYSHVFRMIVAKLAHLGRLPEDPNVLPFEVRILWQGPFETIQPPILVRNLGTSLLGAAVLIVLAVPALVHGRGRGADVLLAVLAVVALLATWLIQRTIILSALVLPVASVVGAARILRRPVVAAIVAGSVLMVPALFPFVDFLRTQPLSNSWYNPEYVQELRQLVAAVRERVPAGEPIACDEVNSTAILAHTDHPILVQPKYEWTAARDRLQEYRLAATLGTPEDLAGFLRAHRARYLVFSWRTLWSTRYQVGIPDSVNSMRPGTVLAQMVQDPQSVPGFELLWKSRGGRFLLLELEP